MTDAAARAAGPSRVTSLSVMMFLQYAVWGVWLPYLANYITSGTEKGGLGFTPAQMGWILGLAGSIGAVSAPFLAGQIADRFLAAEKYLALLLIGGGAVKFATAYVHDYTTFLVMSVLYSVMYMPTLALTNSIAFAHLNSPERQFPRVRTWGTIGWIVASNAFPLIWLQTNVKLSALPPFFVGTEKEHAVALIGDCLRVAGVVSVLYGVWAFIFLPKTPPTRSVEHPFAFLRAFGMLAHPGFLIVTLAALPISMIHQVYFFRMAPFLTDFLKFGQQYTGPIMSVGQFSEIAFLAILGMFLKRLGYRWTLTLGCVAYAARFALFAAGTPETRAMVVGVNVLHGVCYAFFFAGAYVYVERISPKDIRHSAQTVFGIIILGIGPVLAGAYNQWLDTFAHGTWRTVWLVQAGIGLAAGAMVAAAFRPGFKEPEAAQS